MDFLIRDETMSIRFYFGLALLLAAGLIIAVLMRENPPDILTPPHTEMGKLPVSPSEPEAPSKENASKNVKDAIAHLKDLVAKDPTNAATMLELATVLQNAHQPGEALDYYKKGLLIEPGNIDARIDYSLCLFETNHVKEALEQNRIVLQRDPGNSKALYNIGALHANTGLRDSAEIYWKRLIATHPDDTLSQQARASISRLHENIPVQ